MTKQQTKGKKRLSKRRKKQRLVRTVATFFILVIFVLACTLGVLYLRQGKDLDISYSYLENNRLTPVRASASLMTAEPFAADLCVSGETVANDAISLGANEYGALFDTTDKEVLFAESIYSKVYPASITKIMTAIMAIKYGDMDDVVTITEEDVTLEEGSQVVGLKAGDQITMDELFHGLLVYSGNDCAMAIARHLGGSVSSFVDQMNEEMRAIGARGTHFANPSGLHDENHYTTVYDIYLMLNEALHYDYFVDTMQLSGYTVSFTRNGQTVTSYLTSTDHYLTGEEPMPAGVTVLGGKTGYTSAAGNCLAILSQNKYGEAYISIVVRAANKPALYSDMNQLLNQINL